MIRWTTSVLCWDMSEQPATSSEAFVFGIVTGIVVITFDIAGTRYMEDAPAF